MAGQTVSNPNVSIQLLPAGIVDVVEDRRDLIIGQLGSAATATSGELLSNVKQYTKAELKALLGVGELYHRVQEWLLPNGGYSPLDIIGVEPSGTGTAAAGSIAFTGTATAAGTLTVSVVDKKKFTANVAVSSGDTATEIGDAVETAINALSDVIVTAANTTGTVAITADDVGTIGNGYGISVSGTVAGVAYAITAVTGGANDPSVTGIFDVIGTTRYTGISWPGNWLASVDEMTDLLEGRFNAANSISDGVGFVGVTDTYANALATAGSYNLKTLVLGGTGKGAYAPACLKPADWVLAEFMGIRARRLTSGSPIADYVLATNSPKDSRGGGHTASLPYFNTPLANTPVGVITDQYSQSEQGDLEDAGFSVLGVSPSRTNVVAGPIVTTWKTDAAGNENISFHYLNYVDTASICREVFFNYIKATYAQARLSENPLGVGFSGATPLTVKASLANVYRILANAALVEPGRVAETAFINNTTVTINKATGTISINGPLYIVTQARSFQYDLQLAFEVDQTGTLVVGL